MEAPSADGITVPGYEILAELGRGGMGVVYKARQIQLNRPVALKMILSGVHAGSDDLARFRTEAEALARLQHPNIVQVYEVGEHDGKPYFSLEFCAGGSLEHKLKGTPLPPREAAQLLMVLARAMHEAHQTHVIHRDLKPANILLTATEQPKITDFGLAKKLDEVGQTQSGSIMGTPSYMAPEQAGGKSRDIGPLADVYALGAILYELLSGRPPFRATTALDTILQVINDEPVPPSRLQSRLPRDLETICLKCLQKDPSKRYDSAESLAQDLEAYLEDRPIKARPVGRLEHTWRWVKRNKAVAGLLGMVLATLILGVVVSGLFAVQANRNAGQAEKNAQQAEANARQADVNAQKAETERQSALDSLYATRINLAHREWQASNAYRARQILAECPPDRRGWEWHYLDGLFNSAQLTLSGHSNMVRTVAYSPSGKHLATLAADNTTRIWDAQTGVELKTLPAGDRLAFSPDGKALAVAVKGGIQVWDIETGRETLPLIAIESMIIGLDYVEDGKKLATATREGEVVFWDASTGSEAARCAKRLIFDNRSGNLLKNVGRGAVFSPNGRYVAQGGAECKVRVWDTNSGELLMEKIGHLMMVGQVAFSQDSRLLASPGGEGKIRIWDLEKREMIQELRGHNTYVHWVAFSPDDKRLVSGSKDTTARIWDLNNGETINILRGHASEVWSVAFGPDNRVATGSPDATARVWDASERIVYAKGVKEYFHKNNLPDFGHDGSPETLTFYGHVAPNTSVVFSPDGQLLATAASGGEATAGEVRVWDIAGRCEVLSLPVLSPRLHHLAFSSDGRLLAVGSGGGQANVPGEVRLFELPGGKLARTLSVPDCKMAIPTFGPNSELLAASISPAQGAHWQIVWDLASGKELFRKPRGTGLLKPFFTSDGKQLVTAVGIDGMVRLLDTRTGAVNRSWRASLVPLTSFACSTTGLVATANTAGAKAIITLWDLNTGKELRTLEGHVGSVFSLAFSPDGSRLLSGASDFTVKVWHTTTGRELLTFREHRDIPRDVAWSPDGKRLAVVGLDGALKVWDNQGLGTAPVTAGWPVLFRDTFDRPELGERWQPEHNATWSVADGSLRGQLMAYTTNQLTFPMALLTLKGVALPPTVEVSFTCWVRQPLLIGTTLIDPGDPQNPRSLTAFLSERAKPFPFSGAFVYLTTFREGTPKLSLQGQPHPCTLKAGTRYRVLVVREPGRMWVFLDGVEVLSEKVPALVTPVLQLQGSWSDKPGAEIFFDDLEIRAPAKSVR